MPNYKIASEEGAHKYGAELGATVALDLPAEEERAVVAAGWIEPTKQPKEAK